MAVELCLVMNRLVPGYICPVGNLTTLDFMGQNQTQKQCVKQKPVSVDASLGLLTAAV